MTRWLIPRAMTVAWCGLAVHEAICVGRTFGLFSLFEPYSRSATIFLPYILATYLAFRIAAEFESSTWMRSAWQAFVVAGAVGIFRTVTEQVLFVIPGRQFSERTIVGVWNQGSIVAFNFAVLIAMLALWRGFHQLGLGFRVKRRDYALMLMVLILTAWIFLYREALIQYQSPYISAFYLQQLALIVLGCGGAVSIVQVRFAQQMGGGALARSLQWLACFLIMRTAMVAIGTWNDATHFWPELHRILGYGWEAVPWLFALAVSSRARLTSVVAREIAERQKIELHPAFGKVRP